MKESGTWGSVLERETVWLSRSYLGKFWRGNRPNRGFFSFKDFEIAELELPSSEESVRCLVFFGFKYGLCEFFVERGKEEGPQGFGPGEGQERGAKASIMVVREERAEENHGSSSVGEGVVSAGGTCQF